MEGKTRQFRKQPFAWQEKNVLRLLKKKYKKRAIVSRRSVYLALTEIESDFGRDFIRNYTKTIATYAGINRHLASQILKEFEKLGILKMKMLRNKEGKFCGKVVDLLSVSSYPLVDEPPVGEMPHKKVVNSEENNIIIKNFKNERNERLEIPVGDIPPERTKDPVGLKRYQEIKEKFPIKSL